MADFSINDWWMTVGGGRETDPAQGFAAGQRMYEGQKRNELMTSELKQKAAQDQQHNEAVRAELYLRGLNEMSTSLKIRSAISQREAQVAGFQEMSSFISQVAKQNAWDNPEARSQFWEIAARHPSIDADTVRQLDTSTFGEAVKRKEMAARFANNEGQMPADVVKYNFRKKLQSEIAAEKDPDAKAKLEQNLADWERMAGFNKGELPQIVSVVGPDGKEHQVMMSGSGQPRLLPSVDDSKVSPLNLTAFRAEAAALEESLKNGDVALMTNGQVDLDKYAKALNAIKSKYEKGSGSAQPAPAATQQGGSTNASTGKLEIRPGGGFRYIP